MNRELSKEFTASLIIAVGKDHSNDIIVKISSSKQIT